MRPIERASERSIDIFTQMLQLVYRLAYSRVVRLVNFQLGNEMKRCGVYRVKSVNKEKKRVSNMNRTLDLPIHRSDASASRGHLCVL